jgi:hypothetical protein
MQAAKKKRPIKPYVWTEEVLDEARAYYGLISVEELANRLTGKFGRRFTVRAVQSAAADYGFSRDTTQPYLTVAQAAAELGINHGRLLLHCHAKGHRLIGRAHQTRYLPDDVWQAVQAYYAPPPEPCVGTVEAARRLCLTRSAMNRRIARGKWPSYKSGMYRVVPLALVEAEERANRGGRLIGDPPVIGRKRA